MALTLLAPLLAVVALVVRVTMGSPVFFRQLRPGLRGRPFEILKFRTMTGAPEGHPSAASDAERLTAPGRLLRATSLDEVPELVNVVRGDMSLVGPRPLLMDYLPRYTPTQARRHDVRPGITGLAQVSGRNALGWDRKLDLDRQYVEQVSLALDLEILARTVWTVLRGIGISEPGEATASAFTGSPDRGPAKTEGGAR